ncbi:hypothetical protein Poly59_21270 [Rubripirellula reticaptiva]|uniref:Uncharacterized protein n=2 Tax=Rubripirellula reticaptiva TaxID=2528013 RepID=A0A5C6F5M0_9BACT|nr:hypothetical protein Poly59_21270 [Rubripirellula reticaptiva]
MFLGYLLARSGVEVIVSEKHSDFLRGFRGDTIQNAVAAANLWVRTLCDADLAAVQGRREFLK